MSYRANAEVLFRDIYHMEPDQVTFVGTFPEDDDPKHIVYEMILFNDEEAGIEAVTVYISIDRNPDSLVTRFVDENELTVIKAVQDLETPQN